MAPPDFVGVGVQRCGTTWWYDLIIDHPGVWRPKGAAKELHFFDRFDTEPVPASLGADYARCFSRPPGLLAGEWTPLYMRDFWTPRLLAHCAPQAKLLVCLRDPVERYRSGTAFEIARGTKPTAVKTSQVLRSLYHLQLQRLLAYFPKEQLLVLQYEACLDDPAGELRRTYRFLGLEPDDHAPRRVDRRVNASDPQDKPVLSGHAKEDLVGLLLDDARALAAAFPEIDFARWPAFAGQTL